MRAIEVVLSGRTAPVFSPVLTPPCGGRGLHREPLSFYDPSAFCAYTAGGDILSTLLRRGGRWPGGGQPICPCGVREEALRFTDIIPKFPLSPELRCMPGMSENCGTTVSSCPVSMARPETAERANRDTLWYAPPWRNVLSRSSVMKLRVNA